MEELVNNSGCHAFFFEYPPIFVIHGMYLRGRHDKLLYVVSTLFSCNPVFCFGVNPGGENAVRASYMQLTTAKL